MSTTKGANDAGTRNRSTLENTEITELDLEQKEKILRVLYSKVYNGKKADIWWIQFWRINKNFNQNNIDFNFEFAVKMGD